DEAQLTLFQETFDQQEQELGALRRSLEEGTTRLTELKQQEIQMGEQLRSTRDTATRLEREIEAEHSRLENLQQDLDKHTSDLETMIPGLEAGRQQYETKRSEESAVNRAYQSAEQKWHSARDRKNAHEHLVREEQSRLERAQEIITEKRQALDTLNESIKRRKESLKEQEQLKVKLTSKKTELESKLSSLGSQLDDNQSALDAVESEADAVKLQYREHQTELQVLQARAQIISELIQDGEGYPSGTQAILAQKSKFRGLLGTVADLVAVPAEQAEAIETVLGPLAACLVVEKRTQAEAIIQFASENGLGRASIIPLDRLNTSAASEPSPVNFGDAAPLVDFIKAPEQLRPLYNQLLMGFWWSAAAPEGGDQVPPGATLVTGEGHLFGLVEVLTHTGGGDRQEPVTLVGRSAELERLQTRMTELQGFVDESAGMIERLDSQIVALRDTAKSLNTDLDAAIAETNQQKNDLTRVAYEIDREQEDLSDLGKQVPELLTTISSFEASIEAQDKLINDLTAQGPKLDQGISQAQDNFTIAQQGQDAWREELQEIRLRLLGLENSRDNLAQRRLSLKESMEEAHQRLTRLRGEKELASVSISKLESNLAETGGQIKELQGKVHQQQKISAEQEARTRSTRDEISRLEAKIRQQQRGREAALAHQQSLELNIVELEKRAELIKARIQELYAVELDSTQAPDEDLDADELRQSIAQIRGSLERIGPINMAVSEEYDEETKRFNFLDEQRSDLLEAEDSLLETIGKIDHQARAQFRETYDSIRHHFQQTFNLFFEGGEGDLRLMGDPDPLEAAIEIIARPPGKKTKSLRSLSAGEKALTAIALLFAIYLVKPSPFCILDEVDAPLDDINIGKFSKAISQFSSETQFIIVTHNKLTMEQANFLYGVTMEEEGLSRLISVSLEQNAA
ncbi:MAG: hypothetical protein KAU50_10455, partial [Candidatus Marinimicrobia bacterium]|nr:hypothetical protein [Candidatus Neomarinimicrobiota bacterium]